MDSWYRGDFGYGQAAGIVVTRPAACYDVFMKVKSGPIAWLQYIALRMAFAVMQMFPIDRNLATAGWIGRLWPRIMPRHRQRAMDNLKAAYGDALSPEHLGGVADRCLESVAMLAVESICLPRLINNFTWSRYIQTRNLDETVELILSGKGVILVTAHYGSFEVTAHLLAAMGFDVAAIMRPLDNAYLNRFMVQTRRTHGMSLLDKKGASGEAQQVLEDGKLLAFVGDQDAGRKGVFADFFGRPASVYKSIGLLAMVTGRPIVVGYARRLGRGARYEVGVQRVIRREEWDAQADPLRWITQTYTRAIEDFVRQDPTQYWWMHRRWKSQPKSGSAAMPR
jgi:KDO2-lipid IV(A) lauroyltransferase